MALRGIRQLSVVAVIVAAAIPCVFFTLVVVSKETKVDRICKRFANAHPEIVAVVGKPVEVASTEIEANQHNPKVGFYSRLALDLWGPRGEARLTVVLRRGPGREDRWRVAEATLSPEAGGPQPLDVSVVPAEALQDPEMPKGQ